MSLLSAEKFWLSCNIALTLESFPEVFAPYCDESETDTFGLLKLYDKNRNKIYLQNDDRVIVRELNFNFVSR